MGATVVEFTGNQTFDHFDKFVVRFINFLQVVKFRQTNIKKCLKLSGFQICAHFSLTSMVAELLAIL